MLRHGLNTVKYFTRFLCYNIFVKALSFSHIYNFFEMGVPRLLHRRDAYDLTLFQ
jgi:hypothetical protein